MLWLPLGRLKEKNQKRKIETLPSEKQSETKKMGRHGLRLKEAEDRVRASHIVRAGERDMRKSMLCPPGTECHEGFFTPWYNGGLQPFTAGVTLSNGGRDGRIEGRVERETL